ncbi:MAG: ABC transporter permease, partial [Bacteroidota bacterium]
KMFDKLLIMDTGGFPIYYANPIDAVIYFKKEVNHIRQDESECPQCGNVNPEQIFNIIESPVVDEYGNLTVNRKKAPKDWYETYKERHQPSTSEEQPPLPTVNFKVPNKLKQFRVFLFRDILSKVSNQQYLMINLLEAPILALILAYFLRFYQMAKSESEAYVFYENDNLPAFMFIAVIVALFIGLTVSAEEIFKDRKIRKRESFLDLSKISYLFSKIIIMFSLSAVQTLTFVILGNLILGIKGLYFDYWLILFSTACFANMLGLNISASFNSAVTIYIVIPFLLIPQILFSGVIVKFEKLNPTVTSQAIVPVIGEIMASRWAFEALAVNQFKENQYEKEFYDYNREMSVANFRKNFWIPAIKSKLGAIERNMTSDEPAKQEELTDALYLVRNEVNRQMAYLPFINFDQLDAFQPGTVTQGNVDAMRKYLDKVNRYYINQYNVNSGKKDSIIALHQSTPESKEAFNEQRRNFENESLTDLVTNKTEFNQIDEYDGALIQRADPIFLNPDGARAHFYAPNKRVFGRQYGTFGFNILVLWGMSLLLGITLYFDAFKGLFDFFGSQAERFTSRKS